LSVVAQRFLAAERGGLGSFEGLTQASHIRAALSLFDGAPLFDIAPHLLAEGVQGGQFLSETLFAFAHALLLGDDALGLRLKFVTQGVESGLSVVAQRFLAAERGGLGSFEGLTQ
ncbi:hypothetical protein, partial [Thiomonas delicata]|uniref:hypothetical protein n=1 Tax=Thiomonas delicata TaxID=364030 RepID=UPI00164854B5